MSVEILQMEVVSSCVKTILEALIAPAVRGTQYELTTSQSVNLCVTRLVKIMVFVWPLIAVTVHWVTQDKVAQPCALPPVLTEAPV